MPHNKTVTLKSNLIQGLDTYIYGPTGSGKTTGVLELASLMNIKAYKMLISSQMTVASLLGYMDAVGKFVPGIVYEPYTNGGILILDEIDNGNSNTTTVVNGLIDSCIYFPNGMQNRNEKFILVATANTIGQGANTQYIGRNKLDQALLNRFVFLEWDYDRELEREIISNLLREYNDNNSEENRKDISYLSSLILQDIESLRKAINELNINLIISTRNIIQITKMFLGKKEHNRTLTELQDSCIFRGLPSELKEKILEKAKNLKQDYFKDNLLLKTEEKKVSVNNPIRELRK